jgi:hypothetical protein
LRLSHFTAAFKCFTLYFGLIALLFFKHTFFLGNSRSPLSRCFGGPFGLFLFPYNISPRFTAQISVFL